MVVEVFLVRVTIYDVHRVHEPWDRPEEAKRDINRHWMDGPMELLSGDDDDDDDSNDCFRVTHSRH